MRSGSTWGSRRGQGACELKGPHAGRSEAAIKRRTRHGCPYATLPRGTAVAQIAHLVSNSRKMSLSSPPLHTEE
eukprot:scaffold279734_cov26-Tisochrysis_lutea.AAC.1